MADEDDPPGLKPPAKKASPRKPRKAAAKPKKAAKKASPRKAAKKAPAKKATTRSRHLSVVPPPAEEPYSDDELAELESWMAELNDPVVPVEVLEDGDDSEDRAYKAHRLRLRGMPWREIAGRLGYPNEHEVRLAHDKYMTAAGMAASASMKAHALTMQLDRYEDVLNNLAQAAFEGTVVLDKDRKLVTDKHGNPVREFSGSAMGLYVRVLERIDKLMRLEGTEISIQQDIIVIAGTREEYLAGLQNQVRARAVGSPLALPAGDSQDES